MAKAEAPAENLWPLPLGLWSLLLHCIVFSQEVLHNQKVTHSFSQQPLGQQLPKHTDKSGMVDGGQGLVQTGTSHTGAGEGEQAQWLHGESGI